MKKRLVLATLAASTAVSLGTAYVISAQESNQPPLTTIPLDPSHPLTAPSGTTPEGRTFAPMPMFAEQVVIDEYTDTSELEAMLPDLIPVLAQGHQEIAGFADRRQLDAQTDISAPVEVFSVDDVTQLVGYWHFSGGFQALGEPAPPPVDSPVASVPEVQE